MKLACSNHFYNFFIQKGYNNWYVIAIPQGETIEDGHQVLAGFKTKKAAIACAEVWRSWMGEVVRA